MILNTLNTFNFAYSGTILFQVARAVYMYFLAKMSELLDTVSDMLQAVRDLFPFPICSLVSDPVPSWQGQGGVVCGGNVDIDMRKDSHTNVSWSSAGTPLHWRHKPLRSNGHVPNITHVGGSHKSICRWKYGPQRCWNVFTSQELRSGLVTSPLCLGYSLVLAISLLHTSVPSFTAHHLSPCCSVMYQWQTSRMDECSIECLTYRTKFICFRKALESHCFSTSRVTAVVPFVNLAMDSGSRYTGQGSFSTRVCL
jgi:hypothetical protein